MVCKEDPKDFTAIQPDLQTIFTNFQKNTNGALFTGFTEVSNPEVRRCSEAFLIVSHASLMRPSTLTLN